MDCVNKMRALAVSVIFLILCAAGVIKILYPSEVLKNFYIAVGVFELLLATALLVFSQRGEMWAALALVFAAWGGYAFYSTLFGLPCSCLGSAIILPRGVSFGLNVAILGVSWRFFKGINLLNFKWLWLLILILFISGFVSAVIMYNFLVDI